MIRREELHGGRASWILISQVDHAHLAADLAEHFGAGGVLPLVEPEQLLPAVRHHDDGWQGWEQQPQIDPRRGVPYDFTEMPLRDSLDIWRGSIAAAAAIGPLAGYVVSGHFSVLLGRSRDSGGSAVEDPAAAEAFLQQQELRRRTWLDEWGGGDSGAAERAETALAQLQALDLWSLWLCCAPRSEPTELDFPGTRLRLVPRGDGLVEVSPWPLRVEQLTVRVAGRRVAAGKYPDWPALEAAGPVPVELGWRLRPGRLGGRR